MSARHWLKWELLGHDSDPVPASDLDVERVAGKMRERADDARDMHDKLRALADLDGWRGEAAESFADHADDVLGDLEKVEDRYDKVATALMTWKGEVQTAREKSQTAANNAETADETMRTHPAHSGLGTPTPEEKSDDARHDAAKDDLDQARADLQNALDDLDAAAGRAKGDIEEAADVWDDGWWGDFKGWVRAHADAIDFIVTCLEVAAFIAGAAILICAMVATAPFWLIAGAFVLGAALLVGHSMLVAADTGKADGWDIAFDILNLATLGAGGVLTRLAGKGMSTLLPAVASRLGSSTRATALQRLVGGNLTQFNNALRIRNPSNNLFRWTQGLLATATREGDEAAAGVRALANVQPGRLQVLLHQDRGLAQLTSISSRLSTVVRGADEAAQLAHVDDLVRAARVAGGLGGGLQLKDLVGLPGNIGDIFDFADDPQWTTQPTG